MFGLFENYLTILLALPIVFAIVIAFIPEGPNGRNIHGFGISASILLFLYSAIAWNSGQIPATEFHSWFPALGINYAVGADGLSMTLVILTTFLLAMAAVASLTNITKRLKLYYAMLFIMTTAVLGVFLARDLFLFFLFYELELIPMYLLIAIWGGPNRQYAATKFVLYTLLGSVFMFAAILGIYFYGMQYSTTTETLFLFENVKELIPIISTSPEILKSPQILIFLGFFIAFSVKLPVVPFHTWLPDAHVEAPTPVSMLLAGILLKMGAYGMLRLCWEFNSDAALTLSPWIAILAVINIVYTAGVALVQKDLKKLIAYSSVSHMGFVLLGLCAMNEMGFNGAVFVMFAHGLVSAALFMCVGTVYVRTHTRQIADFGGLGAQIPTLFYFFMFMSLASLGLPLLISFASETMVFYGAFTSGAFDTVVHFLGTEFPWNMQVVTLLSAIGIIIGAFYLLRMLLRVFFGEMPERWNTLKDASMSEVFVLASLAALVLVYGFAPMLITQRFEGEVSAIARQFVPYHQVQLRADAYPEAKDALMASQSLSTIQPSQEPSVHE